MRVTLLDIEGRCRKKTWSIVISQSLTCTCIDPSHHHRVWWQHFSFFISTLFWLRTCSVHAENILRGIYFVSSACNTALQSSKRKITVLGSFTAHRHPSPNQKGRNTSENSHRHQWSIDQWDLRSFFHYFFEVFFPFIFPLVFGWGWAQGRALYTDLWKEP